VLAGALIGGSNQAKRGPVMRSDELGIRHYFLMLGHGHWGGRERMVSRPRTKLQGAVHYHEPAARSLQRYQAEGGRA
jgi:hypothetical protein